MSARRDATPDSIARALSQASAWPEGAPAPQWIQTHVSHVFLVGERVYKLRKAVSLGFLDFGTRAARNEDCRREVELNRRLAPSVYLGIAPIEVADGGARVGPVGETIDDPDAEHVVVMRRLPEGTDALSRLERGELDADDVEAIARRLARFHATTGLGRPAPWTAEAWRDRIAQPVLDCVAPLAESGALDARRVEALEADVRGALTRLAPHFEARRAEGRAVDGHGDVHLDHVFFEAGVDEPLLIDCLEFSDDLRRIDAASEVAFLSMDLRYRGRADLAEWFLAAYAFRSDDYGLFPVVDFFAAYRALVRAKVAALATGQESIDAAQRDAARASAVRHAELAESLLAPPAAGEVVLLCGTVGTGKSTVARRMARAGGGVPIVSDRVRKAEAGIPAEASAGDGTDEGLYRPERVEAVYDALLERAGPVVAGGRTAILDAGYGTRARRDRARAWAEARKVPIRLVEVRCSPETARARLAARAREGRDPSDAGPELLATSLERFEPPDEWPPDRREIVHSDDD